MDGEVFAAETAGEKACVLNCQEKTYASFELYMSIKQRTDAQTKTWKQTIDMSDYTEMEVEHAHDTGNTLGTKQGVHVQTATIDNYADKMRKGTEKVRARALGQQFQA